MATAMEKLAEVEAGFSALQGHALKLREELDEARALAERRLRIVKKQRAYIDALVGAAREHGLSPAKDVTRHLNEIAGSDDPVITVRLDATHPGWARDGVGTGQGFLEAADARRVIDWETGKPPVEEEL